MKTFSPIQNFRQGFKLYSSLLTGAPTTNRRQWGGIYMYFIMILLFVYYALLICFVALLTYKKIQK